MQYIFRILLPIFVIGLVSGVFGQTTGKLTGRITDKQSIGSNRLIRNGAIPLFDGEQIIREINPRLFNPVKSVQKAITIELTDKERAILENLGHDPVHIDELANSVDMNITSLLQILLTLEMKNAIQQIGGKQFVRA